MERYKRKTFEYLDDLKERAVNNFEHLKVRFGSNNQNNDEKTEKIDWLKVKIKLILYINFINKN